MGSIINGDAKPRSAEGKEGKLHHRPTAEEEKTKGRVKCLLAYLQRAKTPSSLTILVKVPTNEVDPVVAN